MASDRQQRARILIVEDEALLAYVLEDFRITERDSREIGDLVYAPTTIKVIGLQEASAENAAKKALELIESVACDAAVIDANLAGESAGPAASALAARGVPFIVMTGYSSEQLQGEFFGVHVIQKPARPALVIEALRTMLPSFRIVSDR